MTDKDLEEIKQLLRAILEEIKLSNSYLATH